MTEILHARQINQILERLKVRTHGISQDYMFETFGWSKPTNRGSSGKFLPYENWDDLRAIQKMGAYLYENCPSIRSAIGKMVSYVVSSGHHYDIGVRSVPTSVSPFRVGKKLVPELKGIIEYTMESAYPGGWQAMQEEAVIRKNRDGELFRRIFETDNGLEIRYVEPVQIQDDGQIRDDVYMGIQTAPGDAVTPVGYWFKRITKKGAEYTVIPAAEMQHSKQGVDANDPRGFPLTWMIYCHSQRIKEVDEAMCELAITQAAYAVIRQFDPMITTDDIRAIARGFNTVKEQNNGRPEPGQEVDAKGFTFNFPSMDVDARSFVEIIQQQQRHIAGIFDMPEFLLSADSAGGNRASMIAAEGPFDRRVQREQQDLAILDTELLWRSIKYHKGWSDETLRDARKVIHIEPQFPRAASRDLHKEAAMLIDLVEAGLKSPQAAIAELGDDYEATQLQIKEYEKTHPKPRVAPPPKQETPEGGPDPNAGPPDVVRK